MSESVTPAPARARRPAVRLQVTRRIAEHDEGEWDSLLGPDDVQLGHRFVRACEEARIEDAEHWHVTAHEGDTLVGIASICALTVSLDLLSSGAVRRGIVLARRWRPSFLKVPILVCGLPVSFGQPCLRIRPGVDPAPVLSALDGLMEDVARARGIRLLGFKEFDGDQARSLASLRRLGYFRATSLPSWTLPLPWRSFEEYVSAMRATYRRQVRASLAVRRERELTVRTVDDFRPQAAILHGLYAQVMARAKHRLEHLGVEFFRELPLRLGAACRAIVVERGDDVLAAAIVIDSPGVFTFLLAGIDYERNVRSAAYLNLVLEVVSAGIGSGARRLELGQTSDRLKSRLGARPSPRCFFLRHRCGVPHALLRGGSGLLFPAAAPPARRVFRGVP